MDPTLTLNFLLLCKDLSQETRAFYWAVFLRADNWVILLDSVRVIHKWQFEIGALVEKEGCLLFYWMLPPVSVKLTGD